MKRVARLSTAAFLDPDWSAAWRRDAACLGTFDESFFPNLYSHHKEHTSVKVRRAKAICATCDVTDECLAYALQIGERFGVWGGLTYKERRDVARV